MHEQRKTAAPGDVKWLPGAYLEPPPSSWGEFIFADLQRGIRLVKKVYPDPIDQQIRIGTPEGDYWLAVSLGESHKQRENLLGLIKDFMALKQAVTFIWVCELHKPDAIISIGVSRDITTGIASLIRRHPLYFSKPYLLEEAHIDREMFDMLPRGSVSISKTRMQLLDAWFGSKGKSPAILMSKRVQGGHA